MAEEEIKYCSICNKQIEKYGRRKEDLKKRGWVFCPRHGWIQESVHDMEAVLEPVGLSIEEVPGKHIEQEESPEVNESEILSEIEKPDTSLNQEEEQLKADLSMGSELKMEDFATKKNKSFIGLTISAIFVTVLLFSIFNYFVLKSPINKRPEIKSLKAPVQKEILAKEVKSQVSALPKDSVLVEKSTEQVKSHASSTPQEAISESAKTKPKEKTNEKLSQPLKPPKPTFTVQVGVFSVAFYAKSLAARLNKKGYNSYITISESTGEGKLYKVFVGKFSDREKAEILSAKIKKTEGLQTFVTLRKQQ